MQIKRLFLIWALIMPFLTTCADFSGIIVDMPPSTPDEMPPFVITKPSFEINSRPLHFNYSGVVFNFVNTGTDIIEAITVSFRIFDQRTQSSPLIGTNKFEITKLELIHPDENKEIIISMDRFVYIAPTEPYLIDFFYICRIHYVGGKIWEDKYGKYRIRVVK